MKTIPFNYDLWKASKGRVVYRNGTMPMHLFYAPHPRNNRSIITVADTGEVILLLLDGTEIVGIESKHDILLQIESTYVPLEQKDWIVDGPWWVRFQDSTTIHVTGELDFCGSVKIDGVWQTKENLERWWFRTNEKIMSDPSIPEDQKWVACRKEAM